MQRTCILSILTLAVLIVGCQRGTNIAVNPAQPPESPVIDSAEATEDTVVQAEAEEPAKPAEPAASEPTETLVEEAATPAESASDSEPEQTELEEPAEPKPEETPGTGKPFERPPPRPARMADIDPSEFGPDPEVAFASHAFPPTLSDSEWHADAWHVDDCLRCHETGVGQAPRVFHQGMSDVLLRAKCRSCHVLIPGQSADTLVVESEEEQFFDEHAFPPMIPNSKAHVDTWTAEDCIQCHEDGIKGAPVTKHASQHMPRLLLKVKCRTCHVQVRAIESVLATQ